MYNTNKQKTFFFWNEEWRKILSGAGAGSANTIDPLDRPTMGTDLHYVLPKFSIDQKSAIITDGLVVPSLGANSWAASPAGPLGKLGLVPGAKAGTTGGFAKDDAGLPIIPHQLFDPAMVLYLGTTVLPKGDASDQAFSNVVNPINVRDDVVRIDHHFNEKWAILGHYMHDSVTQGYAAPELGWTWASYHSVTSTLSNPANSAAIKLSGTINPNLLLEASINYDGNVINITNSPNSYLPSGWSGAFTNVADVFKITRNSVPGMSGFGNPYGTAEDTASAPWHNAAEDYEPKVDLSYSQGKHQMKFGFSYNRYTKNQELFGDAQGDFGTGSASNDGIMDYVMGFASSYGQLQAAPIRHYVNQTPSAYVMDNWHVSPRMSLQLGLRYDALPHCWERSNVVSNFNSANYISSQAPIWNTDGSISYSSPGLMVYNGLSFYLNGVGLAGQNGFPRGLVNNDYKTLQPRVGFSDDLFGNGKTVLRGGFGTFFERLQGNDIYNAATSAPFAYNLSTNNPTFSSPGLNWNLGTQINPATLPIFAAGMTNLAADYRAPAVAQFSFGVQHEIKPSIIWVVQYVGNIAWHQNIERHINNFPITTDMHTRADAGDSGNKASGDGPGTAFNNSNLANFNAARSYQGFTDINQQENTTNGNYNGFQTGVRIQNKWGLSGEVDYTWSHEIDLTTYDLNGVSNPWNLKYDKGSGQLDRRQMLSANYIYKLPIFNKSTGLVHSILGGWELAGTVIDENGTPLSAGMQISYDPIGLGGGYSNRPNQSGKVTYPKHLASNWFDPSVFSNPIPAWLGGSNQGFGNSHRDAIVGPNRVNFTTSLYKSFSITERAHVELRFESFNTFNHTEPNGVDGTWNDGNPGRITSYWDSRRMELGGKFVF
jgi:hypothetical protein